MSYNLRRMKNITMAALLSWGAVAVADNEMLLVRDGQAPVPVVIFENAPPMTRQAAEELADYIEKTGGVRPVVIEGKPDPLPQHAIWVGYQPVLQEVFPELEFTFRHPEEILIVCDGQNMVVAGRDVWDPDALDVTMRRGIIKGVQQEYGTVNAVYTFLQDWLGVRWLWPGATGEVIDRRATIAMPVLEYRYQPRIRFRAGLLAYSRLDRGGYGTSGDWSRRQRLQLGSLDMSGGHAFGNWWDRFSEEHPEYFALQPDGSRRPSGSTGNAKLCHSNPDVLKQWLQDVEEQLATDPNRQVFNTSPNDGWSTGHCICDGCEAWDHPDGEMRRFSWRGVSREHVALSDRQVIFANQCARLLRERYPDRDYFVSNMAYGHSRPAPVAAVPDSNVIIPSVTGFWGFDGPERGSPNGTTHREQFSGWAGVTTHMAWRPNTGSPAGWRQGLPDVPLSRMTENMRYLTDHGIIGIYVDSVWEHWATQGPLYYLMAQLVWNPARDGREIMQDYYQKGFGPAAAAVEDYWQLLEDTRNQFVDESGSWNITQHYAEYAAVYNEEIFERAAALLDQAQRLAGESPDILKRVQFIRAGLAYTRLAVATRVLIDRFENSKGEDAAAREQAIANWEALDRLQDEYPDVINWQVLGGERSPLQASFLPSVSRRWR
ncbi:MAG: DUF4838 domain-containing protein [Kiritimatiellia bacterium]|nr:DUF4838 domain-containing protein [Lentisphaerota bacterium]